MLAVLLFVSGLVLVVIAVAFLAGPWWAVLLAGLLLASGGVLTQAYNPRPDDQVSKGPAS